MSTVTHILKTWPEPFQAVKIGLKAYEIRRDDRSYQVGDWLHLMEWCPDKQQATGEMLYCTITYKTPGGQWGIPDELCVLGISNAQDWSFRHVWDVVERDVADETGADRQLIHRCFQKIAYRQHAPSYRQIAGELLALREPLKQAICERGANKALKRFGP